MSYNFYTSGNPDDGIFEYTLRVGTDGKYNTNYGYRQVNWNYYSVEHYRNKTIKGPGGASVVTNGHRTLADAFSGSDGNKLLQKLADKVRHHSFNLAVNVAQYKQVHSMSLDALKRIGLAALDTKRGNFTSAIGRFRVSSRGKKSFAKKDLSGRWLELQYGWLPLIGDVYEAAKAYESFTAVRSERITAAIGNHWKYDSSPSPLNWEANTSSFAQRRIIAELTEDISSPRSLGLYDPLSVVWEVLPWSFVVDWFVPIGAYLDNLSIIPLLRGRFLTTTKIRSSSGTRVVTLDPAYIGSSQEAESFHMERVPSSSLSVPLPSFVGFTTAMSPKHIANAIALAASRFL